MTTPEEQNVNPEEYVENVEVAADEYVEDVVEAPAAPIVFDRPVQTVGRRKELSSASASCPAPATSPSTAAPSRTTSRTRCTSSS